MKTIKTISAISLLTLTAMPLAAHETAFHHLHPHGTEGLFLALAAGLVAGLGALTVYVLKR